MSKFVVEKLQDTVDNPHHQEFVIVVNGTLATVVCRKSITADGHTRWDARVHPEERCPLKPFDLVVAQITARAVAMDAAEAFLKRMRGEEIGPPAREDEFTIYQPCV